MSRSAGWEAQVHDWLASDTAVLKLPVAGARGELSGMIEASGFDPVVIDFTAIADKAGLMAAMRSGLGLDAWFGANWDALGDALYGPETPTERATVLVLQIPPTGLAMDGDDFRMLLQIIQDVAGSGRSTLKGAIALGGSPFTP